METTKRVAGDDVSMYAEPGAVVIKPVRITNCVRRKAGESRYIVSVARGPLESVWASVSGRTVTYMPREEAQHMTMQDLVFVVGRRRSSLSPRSSLQSEDVGRSKNFLVI
jgi:hypothetical protein